LCVHKKGLKAPTNFPQKMRVYALVKFSTLDAHAAPSALYIVSAAAKSDLYSIASIRVTNKFTKSITIDSDN